MTESTERNQSGTHLAARRLIAMERHYRCPACDRDHTSWTRMRSCTACGETLTHAVIRRAALS